MQCKNCNQTIRWSETMGWVHGGLGEGYNAWCDDSHTTEAEAKAEDISWFTN